MMEEQKMDDEKKLERLSKWYEKKGLQVLPGRSGEAKDHKTKV